MAQSELNVTNRDRTGKGVARTLRREGLIPATVYGRGLEPCSIIVEPKALKAAIATEAGWNTLITLKGDGAFSGKVVILKDLQVDAIRRNMKHADFQVINMKKKVHVMVPVHTIGKSAGEKVGGNLQVIRHELEVVCLPTAIPSAIEVDVTDMEIGDVVHIADIALPAGIEVPHEVNFTVITLTGRTVEEEGTEEAEGAEEA
ncbi:MAG TPA: 50S ribosomal protein L25/general stress protein Ctc [Deferrimonas sp.]